MIDYKEWTAHVYFVTEKDCDMPHPYNNVIYISKNKAEKACNDLNKKAGLAYYRVDYYFLDS